MTTMPTSDAVRSLLDAVSGRELMATTTSIARWVRDSGTPDELESFHWIENALRDLGLRTSLIHHRAYISLPGPSRFVVDGFDEPIDSITHAFATSTPSEGIDFELVDGADRSVDVAGKAVLLDGMANGSSYQPWERRGAIAQVYVHDDHLHETSLAPTWGNPTEATIDGMPTTPSIAIRRGDAQRIRDALANGRVRAHLTTEVRTAWQPIPLLTAELPDAPATPFVLLATHVDSWYHGAMDNGSANATVIEVARILANEASRLRRGLRLAFWSGHSHGRFAGSAWYADEYHHELAEHCVAHVFVDSTGGTGATIVTEAPVMPQTKQVAAEAVEAVTGEAFEGKRIGRFADQSFYGIGINSVFGTLSEQDAAGSADTITFKTGGKRAGGLGWWWHTTHDTIDKIDEALLVRDTRIYLKVVNDLLTRDRLPFDYRPAVAELLDTARILVEDGRHVIDLTTVLRDIEDLAEAVAALHTAIDTAGASHDEIVNDTLVAVGRHLIPVAFHEEGRFGRDRAVFLRPLPALRDLERLRELEADSDTAHLIATRMQRNANWVRTEIRAATNVCRRAARDLGDGSKA